MCGFFLFLAIRFSNHTIAGIKQKRMRTDIIFNVFPILQFKYGSIRPDYRFACLLPYSSADTNRCLLQNSTEALLLYSPELDKVLGYELKNGLRVSFSSQHPVDQYSVVHFHFSVLRVEDHITTRVFDYIYDKKLLKGFFRIVSIISKAGLKVAYKQSKKELFAQAAIDSGDEIFLLNPHIYEFDEGEFALKKINEVLLADKLGLRVFGIISNLFLSKEGEEGAFASHLLRIGKALKDHVTLDLRYQEN